MLENIAKHLAGILADHYEENGDRFTQRDLAKAEKGAFVRENLKDEFQATRAIVERAIEYGVDHEILRQVGFQKGGRPGHHIYPFWGTKVD